MRTGPLRAGEGDVGDRQDVVVVRTAVRDQFVRMSRPAVALEIIRRRHQEPPQRHDRLTDDVFAADVARLDADVVALLDRIVDAIIVVQLDDQLGVLLLKPAHIARRADARGTRLCSSRAACR